MDYTQALNYIHSLLKFGIKPGLDRIEALLNELGNPQKDLKFVHVAGTNGKGTSSTMMSEILIKAGFKTGLFTSPYVFDFCERIKIDSQSISRSDLALYTERVKDAAEKLEKDGLQPTEFEFITALALLYFKEQNCDYVVLEVGLGGRLDSTNIIDRADVCIITSISLDHMQVLGNTIEEIAAEKCGIIKENSVVVTTSLQDRAALSVIKDKAKNTDSKLIIADYDDVKIINADINGTEFLYKGKKYKIRLLGEHQIENTIGVIVAAQQIENICYKDIYEGVLNTVMHARMELIDENTLIEGGHNEECSLALKDVINKYLPDKDITAVIGMMADKAYDKYLENIVPLCKKVIFTKPDNHRAEEPENLKNTALKYNVKIVLENNPKIAYDKAKSDGNFTVVCGSFYLISDIFN